MTNNHAKDSDNDSDTRDAQHDEDDVSFDMSSIKKLFSNKKVNTILLTIFLIIIPVILTIYIRVQPQYLPATDSMAQNAVNNYYKNTIAQQVNAQYPNLPATQKQKLIDDQFSQFAVANKDLITQQTQQTSAYFKSGFQYQENNHTYTFLGDLDSYSFLRIARNLKDKGMICDEIRDGVCYDNHMLAPLGLAITPGMHVYSIFYFYKFMNSLNPTINLMQAQFYLPTLLAVIAAIAAFFIGRRLMNNVAGFFAAMLIAVSPLFLSRTLGADTDIWNIMFPLVIIWIFLEAYEAKTLLKKIILAAIAGIACGLFSFAWSGWWYVFDFIMVSIIGYILFEIVKRYITHKRLSGQVFSELKNDIIIFVVLIISAAIFVSLFSSFSSFASSYNSPLGLSSTFKSAAHADLWPNVYTTVAELNSADIPTIVNQVAFGMNILFGLSLLGIIFTMVKRKPNAKEYWLIGFSVILFFILASSSVMSIAPLTYLFILTIPVIIAVIMLFREKESAIDVKPAFLLTIWFIGMIFASIQGVRFILLLIPTFCIALAVAIGYLYQYFSRIFAEEVKISETISGIIVFILLCLILIAPVQIGISAGKSYMPSMTRGWWDSLMKIREQSAPDAIINSWWDFGHWFKYVADRRVTLDGATQNSPQAHWLGQILQTNDENRSVAILRMLDCGSNNAFEEVDKKYNDTEKSENIVSEIILLSKDGARAELQKYGYSSSEIDKILSYTHCSPPEDYFITSEDMVGKAGVWAHFGVWSFDRAFIINNIRNMPLAEGVQIMRDRWNYSEDEATKIYYDVQALQTDREMNDWIAPWPSYANGNLIGCSNMSEMVLCDLNMGVGSNGVQNIVLERAVINLTDPAKSQVLMGAYDKTTNVKVGENIVGWKEVVIAGKDLKKYEIENGSIGLSFLLNIETNGNQTSYSALVADPLLIDSTFTKLFFLDGKYMPHFEKFSDISDMTGSRIIIWKVRW